MSQTPSVRVADLLQFPLSEVRRSVSRAHGPPRLSYFDRERLSAAAAGMGLSVVFEVEAGEEWVWLLPPEADDDLIFARFVISWQRDQLKLTDAPTGQTLCEAGELSDILATLARERPG